MPDLPVTPATVHHREFSPVKSTLVLLNQPGIDISPFNSIVAKSTVGDVDTRRLPPIGKFAELVGLALPLGPAIAYRHLYLAWYIQIPGMIATELSQFDRPIQLTASQDEFMTEGIMSASFETWRAFLSWATTADRSRWMNEFGYAMFKALGHHSYFKMEVVEGPNKILMLRGS